MLQRPVLSSLDDAPTVEETQNKNKQLQAGKEPVADGIPPKIFKEGGEVITVKLTELMQQFWVKDSVPEDFKDANAIHLYKNKGDRASCDNHSTEASRCWVFQERSWHASYWAVSYTNSWMIFVSESQCALRRNRGTIDIIFALAKIKENAASRIRACTSSLCTWPRPLIRSVGGLDVWFEWKTLTSRRWSSSLKSPAVHVALDTH